MVGKALNNQKMKTGLKNILLFGAPGVGKGTYGKLLERDLKFPQISTGDQIRKLLKSAKLSPEMEEIKGIINRGELINDQMAIDLLVEAVNTSGDIKGVLVDGFPRNLAQLELYVQHFDTAHSFVVNCLLREDILVEKLSGRRVCSGCGGNFNICDIKKDGYDMRPLLPKVGDGGNCCGHTLEHRADDEPEVVRSRLQVYKQKTEPLLKRFSQLGIRVLDFEPKRGVDDYPQLKKLLDEQFLSKY
jgi:adenylate kinase